MLFPSLPIDNTLYTLGSRQWVYHGAWQALVNGAQNAAVFARMDIDYTLSGGSSLALPEVTKTFQQINYV